MYKIRYDCNLLMSMNEFPEGSNSSIMQGLAQSTELGLFDTELIQETIQFKWEQYASKIHYIGAILHFSYAICLITYIKYTFVIE
jgi:hypothetical protein